MLENALITYRINVFQWREESSSSRVSSVSVQSEDFMDCEFVGEPIVCCHVLRNVDYSQSLVLVSSCCHLKF